MCCCTSLFLILCSSLIISTLLFVFPIVIGSSASCRFSFCVLLDFVVATDGILFGLSVSLSFALLSLIGQLLRSTCLLFLVVVTTVLSAPKNARLDMVSCSQRYYCLESFCLV